jgi:2,3-bisphosphoglycerate-independent phosphoglycerate mutase
MSAAEVAVAVVQAIKGGDTEAVIVNFANADMVGHSGVFLAAVRAVETVDQCLGQIITATLAAGGVVLVSADHGNAEEMIDRVTGEPMTAHTTNPVPVVLVAAVTNPAHGATLSPDGALSAVAPTLLELMDIDPPRDMTQVSLLVRPNEEVSR